MSSFVLGLSLATAMVNAGLTSFSKIEATNARELELVCVSHASTDSSGNIFDIYSRDGANLISAENVGMYIEEIKNEFNMVL